MEKQVYTNTNINVYQLNYTTFIPVWGNCNKSVYVKATTEEEALEIGKKLIKDNRSEIKIWIVPTLN